MKFTQVSADNGATCLACEGQITQREFQANEDPLHDLLGNSGYSGAVLLDLEKTDYIDSSGIGWLLSTHRRFLRDGGQLILHSVPPMVFQVVRLMRLDKVLNIQPDLALAKSSASERET
jgi:anti-anti-sigma factor